MTFAQTHQDIFVQTHGKLGNFTIDVAFHAPLRGVTALFGPSGCGKTSILRAVAGLNHLNGSVRIGEQIWQQDDFFLPTHKRAIGYVFQEASLFPHLSVHANLTFGKIKAKHQTQSKPEFDFDEVVAILNLEHLIERAPHHLSGGERQRVAIGRALLSNPQLLLMDEPLSALDQAMREEIMPFLMRLREHLHIPIFYISHDMREIERLADYLVLMKEGHLIACGDLQHIQSDTTLPLAQAYQAAVSVKAQLINWDATTGLSLFQIEGGQLRCPQSHRPPFPQIRLKIAAQDVSITLERPVLSSILNILPVRIISAHAVEGHEMLVKLALCSKSKRQDANTHILSRISAYSWHELQLQNGQQVFAQIKGLAILPH